MRFGIVVSRVAISLVGAIGAVQIAPAPAAESYIVPKQGVECFRQHIDDYEAAKRDPVVVYFPICPKVDFTAQDLQSGTVDSLPIPGPAIQGARNVITLTKAEIGCIAVGRVDIVTLSDDSVRITLGHC